MPGPRKLLPEERLALSNDALKMNGIPSRLRYLTQHARRFQHQAAALDDAGARDQKERLIDADLEIE